MSTDQGGGGGRGVGGMENRRATATATTTTTETATADQLRNNCNSVGVWDCFMVLRVWSQQE